MVLPSDLCELLSGRTVSFHVLEACVAEHLRSGWGFCVEASLLDHQLENVAKFHPESRIVAIYQFATPQQIAAVQKLGALTLAWPVSWQEIEHASATTAGMPLRAARTAARRFSDEELIAVAASNHNDPANCPQHLVELINGLNAFADYTLNCADEAPEPQIYQRVHTDATQARAQLELALEVLVEAEAGFPTPN